MSKAKLVTQVADALLGGGKKAMKADVAQQVTKRRAYTTITAPEPVIKAPRVKEVTGGDLAKQANTEKELAKRGIQPNIGRRNYGARKPGSPLRRQDPTKTKGARTIIASEPMKMIKAYPELKEEINLWMRNAYTYARENGSLEGYQEFVGPDGRKWRPKPAQGAFEGLRLKGDDKFARAKTIKKRSSRENPWTKEDMRNDIYAALLKIGKEHHFDRLLQIMKTDHKRKMDSLRAKGITKGHYISMIQGGLDVAENFGPQRGKSLKIKKGDSFVIDPGNYAEKEFSTTGFGAGKGLDNWDDYIRLKLSELE